MNAFEERQVWAALDKHPLDWTEDDRRMVEKYCAENGHATVYNGCLCGRTDSRKRGYPHEESKS